LKKKRGRFFIGGREVQISSFELSLLLQIVPSGGSQWKVFLLELNNPPPTLPKEGNKSDNKKMFAFQP
jgi:hypothetical protein